MESKWASFLYQYGLGGLFFLISITVLIRKKALDRKKPEDLKIIFQLAAGLLVFFSGHALLILASGR